MNKQKKLIVILGLLFYLMQGYAQHDNVWYFGRWAGLDFSTGSPVARTDSAMSPLEGSTVMCDPNGNLLFYSQGTMVYNRNHQIMQNGMGLNGDHSSTQSAIAIPAPGQPGIYYLFVTDQAGFVRGLSYSIIDMAAANGLGAIVTKNVQLVAPTCEKLAATFHANGRDVWITTHHWGSNAFYSYLLTAAGLNPVPVISNTGAVVSGTNNSARYVGHTAFSPDGSHFAVLNRHVSIELFDFDNATGFISNPKNISNASLDGYGIEFSPSGKMLYVVIDKKLFQYRADAADISSTGILLNSFPQNGSLRLAPDGKIYIVENFFSTRLSAINNPDVAGTGCNYVQDQVDLLGRQTVIGLPSFLASPLYITGVNATGTCSGTSVSFTFTATKAPDSVEWDFGDGGTSTAMSPMHTYANAGTYTVKAKARIGYIVRYHTRTVTIQQTPVANQPQDMYLCDDDTDGSREFNIRSKDGQILGSQPSIGFTISYHTSQADADANTNPLPDFYTNISNGQVVYARVMITGGCYVTTTFRLFVNPKPVITMQDEYTFCSGNTTTLTAPSGFDNYVWSNGQTGRVIQASPGVYTLKVFKNYAGGITCDAEKTIAVRKSGAPVIRAIETSDWTDSQNTIRVVAEGAGTYEYSIDGISYQQSPVFSGLQPGLYTVYVRDIYNCGNAEKDIALLMYPKFFTPNGDGINELWQVKFARWEPGLKVHIFDRFGKLITGFMGTAPGWDGTYNGHRLPATDYWFTVTRTNGKEYKGHFSMLR